MNWLKKEGPISQTEKFDFEQILEQCGFQYYIRLPSAHANDKLWEVHFE